MIPIFIRPSGRLLLVAMLCGGLAGDALGQGVSPDIRINQVGFWPGAPKAAVVVDAPTIGFEIASPDLSQVVFSGVLSAPGTWVSASSTERARIADFSEFAQEGTWVVVVPGMGTSHPFEIREGIHEQTTQRVLKGFYFARASTRLEPARAGVWSRPGGHPDTEVLVHASAATDLRPEGTTISSPRGWYDAGDYNKYVVNSGITTGTLLMLYERFPAYFAALDLDIPESGDAMPDLLDEVLWNLRWMMSMQDPGDGGVYHKLTTPQFEGIVMPHNATQPRYVVQKSTAAALDFAAVAAIGARVFDDFPGMQSLADSLLDAAVGAWIWAQYVDAERPYDQDEMNAAFDPDIHTGEYGDFNLFDEYQWAATELFITTRADSFMVMYPPQLGDMPSIPGWSDVGSLGLWSLALHRDQVAAVIDTSALRTAILRTANQLAEMGRNSSYGIVFGNSASNFHWGSNALAANQGNMLLVAHEWVPQQKYVEGAVSNLDYLLGRNALGYSFVTGVGDRPPLRPHHRPSEADGWPAPVPGLLVGGPNAGRQDGCTYPYPANQPAKSYTDQWCSYASNEVAINWQASISFLAGALEAMQSPTGLPVGTAVERNGAVTPEAFGLEVWPSPARGATSFRMSLARAATVSVAVYDMTGREVATLLRGERLAPGRHDRGLDTAAFASGVYVIRVVVDGAARAVPLAVIR